MITLGKDAIIIISVCIPVIAILIAAVIVVSVLGFSQDHQPTIACQNDNGPSIIGSGSTIDWQSLPAQNGVLSGDGTRFFYFTALELDKIYTFNVVKSGGLVAPVLASEGSAEGLATGKYALSCSYDGSILASYSLDAINGTGSAHITTVNENMSTQTIPVSTNVEHIGGVCTSYDGEYIAVSLIRFDTSSPDERIAGAAFIRKAGSNYAFNGFLPGLTFSEVPPPHSIAAGAITSDGLYYVSIVSVYLEWVPNVVSFLLLYKRNVANGVWALVKVNVLPNLNGLLFKVTSYLFNNDPRFPDALVFMVSDYRNHIFVYTLPVTESLDIELQQTINRPPFIPENQFGLDFSVVADPCIQYLYISASSTPGFLFCKMDPQTLLFSEPELVDMLQPNPSIAVISSTADGSMLVTSVTAPISTNGKLQIFTN